MKAKHVDFGSIEAFKNVIQSITHTSRFAGVDEAGQVIYNNDPLPTLQFTGTVKIHGTNAGISMLNGELYPQKRSSIVTEGHFGFPEYVFAYAEEFKALFSDVFGEMQPDQIYTIFAEWSGPGVQKGVGISNIPEKSCFLLATSISRWVEGKWEKEWLQLLDRDSLIYPPRCYSIYQFPTYAIEIDFNMPQLAQNRLIEITNAVEAQCPVAAQLGVEGVGEGVVWTTTYKGNQYRFKVKGEKHSNTKVKTLAEVDDAKLEKIQDAVMYLVAPARLEQALFETQAKEKKDTPEVLRWIANDIIKEESGTLVRNGLEWKDVARSVSDHYRRMFFDKIDKL